MVETICVNAAICMTYLQNMPVDVDNEHVFFFLQIFMCTYDSNMQYYAISA